MSKQPKISIIIVNYNGRHLLKDCLTAVYNSNYPLSKIEVILVDNCSRDGSGTFVAQLFPKVKIIELSNNLGFAGGNIEGLKYATGEYIVLLNNDTEVHKDWLKHMVAAAQPRTVGIVSPKLYFAIPFLELTLTSDVISRSDLTHDTDFSPIGLILENVTCRTENLTNLVWYKDGFYEQIRGPIVTRWTKGKARILVPFQDAKQEEYVFTIHGYPTSQRMKTPITLSLGKLDLVEDVVHSNQVKQFTVTVTKQQARHKFIWLVQNAGNIILHDGYSKDRGSITEKTSNGDHLEFYEEDSEYFNKPTKLLSMCGACCLIKRAVIDEVGFFDGHYFMYYEDVDLSMRAWRAGWDIMYEPQATVLHHHKASTSQVSSSFFIEMVEKNHMAFTMVHFPLTTFLSEFVLFWLRTSFTVAKALVFRFRDNLERFHKWNTMAEGRLKAASYILKHLVRLFGSKMFWIRRQKRDYHDMKELLY